MTFLGVNDMKWPVKRVIIHEAIAAFTLLSFGEAGKCTSTQYDHFGLLIKPIVMMMI